ncbi:conserved hypothetical protein [Sinorhizobium medicae]|uniref:Uncharacterized protein n=2 Tax=Sinorhizobium medicae TaxID=110321 RepID=A0A508WW48_9HYPH|nr:conserved hypothetical protein [Sinorhizobium medicae]
MTLHDSRLTRSPNGMNFHRWLEGFGVRVRHFREGRSFHTRPANIVYGGRTLKRLWARDTQRAETLIRCIQVADARCFDDYTMLAVWHFIGAHAAQEPADELARAFGSINLSRIVRRGHRLAKGQYGRMGKVAEKISSLLADALIPEEEAA